jgi:C1A family cysteine protease
MPSRLFIYWNERELEGTTDQDAGAQIRDGLLSLVTQGACPETDWPYDGDPSTLNFAQRPDAAAYQSAAALEVHEYLRVDNSDLNSILQALVIGPVVFGFTVFESFEWPSVAQTGNVTLPDPGEAVIGGHAVLAVGYSIPSGHFIVRNSWGTRWGQSGYCTMPFAYLTNPDLATDFWLLRKIT